MIIELRRSIPADMRSDFEKLVYFCSPTIERVRLLDSSRVEIQDAERSIRPRLERAVQGIADQMLRRYRNVAQKVLFRCDGTTRVERDPAALMEEIEQQGLVQRTARGCYAVRGLALMLMEEIDSKLRRFAQHQLRAKEERYPTLLRLSSLQDGGYADNFPHLLNFVYHLHEDCDTLASFTAQHRSADEDRFKGWLSGGEDQLCLTPSVCYPYFDSLRGQVLPVASVVTARGRCFRYESGSMRDLRRLREFTMREIVIVAPREAVDEWADTVICWIRSLCESLRLRVEMRSANDAFCADAHAEKRFFQLTGHMKYELLADVGNGDLLAIGSLNLHNTTFSTRFRFAGAGGGEWVSACLGFGLERWAFALLAQRGFSRENFLGLVESMP